MRAQRGRAIDNRQHCKSLWALGVLVEAESSANNTEMGTYIVLSKLCTASERM